MYRMAGYNESRELTLLIEQLREQLGAEPSTHPQLSQQLEDVLSCLVVRNQRLRVLQRLERMGRANEHVDSMREALEKLDEKLLQQLPALLERLQAQH